MACIKYCQNSGACKGICIQYLYSAIYTDRPQKNAIVFRWLVQRIRNVIFNPMEPNNSCVYRACGDKARAVAFKDSMQYQLHTHSCFGAGQFHLEFLLLRFNRRRWGFRSLQTIGKGSPSTQTTYTEVLLLSLRIYTNSPCGVNVRAPGSQYKLVGSPEPLPLSGSAWLLVQYCAYLHC